ncbi:MAG TPA: UvrD-helicase domain-containing protein [Solirubrobacteraceae bacterium]|nr:UvrD-helicase domain-containing protein [Solirubrobacteraceae bacterium]
MCEQEAIPARLDWTPEQLEAIESRSGELFLDAGAGSGKTAVLVERFVRAVLQDGIDVAQILTITFTDKAAGEMRERIRERLRELGAVQAARDTETAFISTIHGFCARLVRTHALAAGIDPEFTVLDEVEAARLAERAFDAAVEEVAADPEGERLVATYGLPDLRGAMRGVYGQLRARGQTRPALPAPPEPAGDPGAGMERVRQASAALRAELAAVAEPSARVAEALDRLERVGDAEPGQEGWPGDLDALRLPSGNGAALRTPACEEYAEALSTLREQWAAAWARRALPQLERLLEAFGRHYEQQKRGRSGLDFQDLELMAAALLRQSPGLSQRYQERFERVMVDELQDTNAVQLELIEAVSKQNLFTVGDAQQAIYGFRHAEVELFEGRGQRLAAAAARATLQTNFRSRPEILDVINRTFADALGDAFRPLVAGRSDEPDPAQPRVELLLADREAEWARAPDSLAAPWRLAEARILADRVAELVAEGASPGQIVVLTRASTDLRAYERALETCAVPTYLIGGRGYWSHPQVVDMVAYLRLLANPRDEEAVYTVLASPLVGVSYDALVLLGAAARQADRDPWWVLSDPPEGGLDGLDAEERARLTEFAVWVAGERTATARMGVEELIDRALERTGYDLAVLAMPGGQRRLANVRKLMRLGREHQAAEGPHLRGFLELARDRARGAGFGGGGREGEAPVESEALDAVRLMTIHRAKGLEFDIVCVADLGRAPWRPVELVRVGGDGRVGLRLARPGTGPRENALAYDELGEEQKAAEAAEERRLFYVAATRAKERLIFSGAARLDKWGVPNGGAPISWLGPALVPELPGLVEQGETRFDGVRFVVRKPEDEPAEGEGAAGGGSRRSSPPALALEGASPPPAAPTPAATPSSLSYSAISEYQRCGYRFYAQRVLRLPAVDTPTGTAVVPGLAAADRGTLVHALLERLDFRRPVIPGPEAIAASEAEAEEIARLLQRFAESNLCQRLGRARGVAREQPFGFLLGQTMITGVLDVITREGPGKALVVDYKTDRLEGADPASVVRTRYATQRLIYALAALRDGAAEVKVVHVFLEQPEAAVLASFTAADAPALQRELEQLVAGLERRDYAVTESPQRGVCHGCPAEGGLCSWPLEMTRRDAPDRLF